MGRRGSGWAALLLVAGVLVGLSTVVGRATPAAAAQPSGFSEQIVLSGLTRPTKLVFAPDGRVFVAEKSGAILVYDNVSDTTPTVFADLSADVHNWEDHGLLGLAVPPNFPTSPYVYALYTANAPIGVTTPVFPDYCPDNSCVMSGRLVRLRASGDHAVGAPETVLNDWCEVSETHTIGNVAFGPDGDLWVSGGEGASATEADYGQAGRPTNPCADPPANRVGTAITPPTAEGGALRAQSARRTDGRTLLGGTLIRLDANTFAGAAGNPNAGSADANQRRIVAHGLRNPLRFAFRPGTTEAWVGDVGWNNWEEVNRVDPHAPTMANLGWPCYEGNGHQPDFDHDDLARCESLYTAGTATGPYYAYNHARQVVPGESCAAGGSSTTGLAFYPGSGGSYPAAYHGALFMADYSRKCIWAMLPGAGGLPDPNHIVTFDSGAQTPVDLEIGPGGDLYYVDITGGTVRRIRYSSTNHPPTANATVTPLSGHAPLTVSFDGHPCTDPDAGDILHYAWDFDNNGSTDATGIAASHTYATQGTFTAKLTVTDSQGLTSAKTFTIAVDNQAPVPIIDSPTTALHYAVGDTIAFTGHATDPQDGTEPASRLAWSAILHHCYAPTNCHDHFIQSWTGTAGGSFPAPDHEYPSYVELQLTARDAGGAASTTSLRLDPQTVPVTVASNPSGLLVSVGPNTGVTPFTTTMVARATDSISALSPQTAGGTTYTFSGWSDGGAASHTISAPTTATTITTTYRRGGSLPSLSGTVLGNAGRPVPGAVVTLTPDGRSASTDQSGHFTISGVNAGTYTVTASLATGQCADPVSAPVTMSGPQTVTLTLTQRLDASGTSCVDVGHIVTPYLPANTVLNLRGDDAVMAVPTPFPVRLYNSTYTSAWVDTNGVVSFVDPGHPAPTSGHLPGPGSPWASVFAFWDDLNIDPAASVRTQTTGTAPHRRFVVEWRNAAIGTDPGSRITAEAIFAEGTGTVTFTYQSSFADTREMGAGAVIGVVNAGGTDGFEYAYHQPLLRNSMAITISPPATGPVRTATLTGRVSRGPDPVPGATVRLSPIGATTTTAADGSYAFTNLPYGSYSASATADLAQCGGASANGTALVNGPTSLNLAASGRSDGYGYTCSGAGAYLAATTPLALTGDDSVLAVATPFPVRLYGSTYQNAWIDTNGLISFADPGGSAAIFGPHLPTAGPPNAAVYAFWDDLNVDSAATVWTATTGAAPNRQYIVEWRNAGLFDDPARITAEAIFAEATGDITLAYHNLPDTDRGHGSTAVVGLENPTGTDGFEYSYRQAVLTGTTAVTFHPPAAPA